jgi:hypothetical protein
VENAAETLCAPPGLSSRWERTTLRDFWHSLDKARLEEDRRILSAVFDAAARRPLSRQAIRWMVRNDARVILDRTCTNAGGHYQPGTGVAALAWEAIMREGKLRVNDAVDYLTHEAFHAFQDDRGLGVPSGLPLVPTLIAEALVESTAHGMGRTARMGLDSTGVILGHMQEWYFPPLEDWRTAEQQESKAQRYGLATTARRAWTLGLLKSDPDERYKFEFRGPAENPRSVCTDTSERLRRANADFLGYPIFHVQADKNFLKKIHDPRLASHFFDDLMKQPCEAVRRVLAEETRRAVLATRAP